jgi:hypothetical protein
MVFKGSDFTQICGQVLFLLLIDCDLCFLQHKRRRWRHYKVRDAKTLSMSPTPAGDLCSVTNSCSSCQCASHLKPITQAMDILTSIF